MRTIDVYTDGSIKDKRYGYGIFIMDEQEKEYNFSDKFTAQQLGDTKIPRDINGMEWLAIKESLQILVDANAYGKNIILYTDSDCCLQGLRREKLHCRYQGLRAKIRDLLFLLDVCDCTIDFRKVPSHRCIYGNVKADQLAKCGRVFELHEHHIKSCHENFQYV